ncbi:MAG TPA: efflux transporter outer membrane subunit [Caldimonas sp.]|nr:efflux transporter outer membrane subunit [Caldimonas sp.]HEX4236118.1 efflux transporter outer membrane subunit [Caldimonas sp.]
MVPSRHRRLAVAAAALALAGCTSLIPPYQRPAAPVAATYPEQAASAPAAAGEAAADVDWQRFFADPRLKRLIALALADNRDLRVAVLNIEQTRALYQVRRADELPTVGAGGSVSRTPVGSSVVTVYAVGLTVTSYELDLFGRVHDLSQAALAQYFATAEARKAAQISIVSSVANAYLNVLADDELLRVTRQTLESRVESNRLTKLRFDNGVSSELDYRQAESLLEGARAALAQAERQRMLDENALVLLVGQALPPDLPPPLPLDQQQIPIDLPAGLPSDLLVRRPDIRASEQQLLAANANIGAARAAFFPRITLTASYGTASSELSGLFKSGSWAFTGTAQLLQPIFDAGRNQANLDVARVDRDIAVAQYERSIQNAFREVSDALAGRATFGEQLRAQAAQTNALAIAYRLADLRYRSGAASFLDSLDAARTLFAAQTLLVQTRALELQNLVTLYRALGGGWNENAELAAGTTPAIPPPR